MPDIGPLELVIILLIALVVLGPKRLPGLGKQLGTGMREFKDAITGKDKDDDAPKPALDAAAPQQPAAPTAVQPAPAAQPAPAPAEPVAAEPRAEEPRADA
ncbi:MAG TPA: twin-arginine translocase TatA/TatE family subunit [Solirubrobacteraceae bacterium]|nr:twin-arginine translocase TatA/TatE family subunit [Solirubrobacteraceae bacterium]